MPLLAPSSARFPEALDHVLQDFKLDMMRFVFLVFSRIQL